MPEVKISTLFRVVIIESERGWGQRIDEVKYFDNEHDARRFCSEFNAANTEKVAPDWYMYADYQGRVS